MQVHWGSVCFMEQQQQCPNELFGGKYLKTGCSPLYLPITSSLWISLKAENYLYWTGTRGWAVGLWSVRSATTRMCDPPLPLLALPFH